MISMCDSLLLALSSLPQAAADGAREPAVFAPPVRLMAGDAPMGKGRLFPSPALYDLDGDGVAELVLGDLIGKLTVCKRQSGDEPRGWTEATPLNGANGEALKFHNW